MTKRIDDLTLWLKRDTDSIFEEMKVVQSITAKSEKSVRIYT